MEYIEMLKPLLTAENFKTTSIVVQIYGVLLIIITMIMVKNAVLSPCSRGILPKNHNQHDTRYDVCNCTLISNDE